MDFLSSILCLDRTKIPLSCDKGLPQEDLDFNQKPSRYPKSNSETTAKGTPLSTPARVQPPSPFQRPCGTEEKGVSIAPFYQLLIRVSVSSVGR